LKLIEAIKQANRPGPPEHSIVFRVAAAGAVAVAVAACWAEGELSAPVTGGAILLMAAGNLVSYKRRNRPLPLLKPVLALAVVVAFGWFFVTVSSRATVGDLASVEGPLAVLFTIIQVTHSFDVPARRDLGFSLAGSATLMAAAAAQAVNGTFGAYVVVWAALGMIGLLAMSSSMSGGGGIRARTVALTAAAVLVIGFAMIVVLPPPQADSNLVLPSAIANDLPVPQPAGLVGGGAQGTEPVKAGSVNDRTRVGGFLGFAGPLDTAIRAPLGTEVVFRVRADRPTFWVAETFNEWSGTSWDEAPPPAGASSNWRVLQTGSPFSVPLPTGEEDRGSSDYQTFYLAVAGPNLVFHAANAAEVWFPARKLYVSAAGTLRSGTSMGPGSIYTVLSEVNQATPSELEAAEPTGPAPPPSSGIPAVPGSTLPKAVLAQSLQLPRRYRRAAALASRVTAHAHSVYAKVVALEDWIGAHTKYTTDIPPLRPGQDTVNEFLFGNRRGYCEQISTSLAVMLRTLGIPAREATGYVPGPYNPITDLYEVQADDAHAWVQVWFPGYGWQSFDPTAYVPLANPSSASVLGHDLADVLRNRSVEVAGAVIGGVALFTALVWIEIRRRRRMPSTWAGSITQQLDRAARRIGLDPPPGETLVTTASRIDRTLPASPGTSAVRLALVAEQAAYGGSEPSPAERRLLLAAARKLRRRASGQRLRRRASGRRLRRSASAQWLRLSTGLRSDNLGPRASHTPLRAAEPAPTPPTSAPRPPTMAGRP